MCAADNSPKRFEHPLPTKPTAEDIATRRQITPEEEEEWIRHDEKRLETLSGIDAERLREEICKRKEKIAQMRAGTLRIYQRIPKKITPARQTK